MCGQHRWNQPGLLRRRESTLCRVAFFSKNLSPTQARYSTLDRELLAAFSAVRHFHFLLEGRRFRILTDHKPLVAAMSRVSPLWSARQQRLPGQVHRLFPSHSRGDICRHRCSFTASPMGTPTQQVPASQILPRHAAAKAPVAALPSGAQNPPSGPPHTSQVVAVQELITPEAQPLTTPAAPPSAASLPAITAAQPLDFAALAAAQLSCPDVSSMRASMALSIVSKPMGEHQLLGDVSTGEFSPLLPPQFRAAAFHSLHNIAHPGIRASCRLVSSRFCWPHLCKQVAALARTCLHCQRSKVHKHMHLQPQQIEVLRRRFAHVHVDLVGPLPRSAGYSYLLTVLARLTRWPEAIPLAAMTAADCAAGFSTGGSSGSAFQPPSPATGDLSLHPSCGQHSAHFSTSPMCRPLPITPRQTALWSAFTAD